jgi:hypothetical protein
MARLPELPVEVKALASAALIFCGIGLLMSVAYIYVSHRGVGAGMISIADIAALYTRPGVSLDTLISLAHIHLLGLVSVFSIVGFVFVHSTLRPGWKVFWSLLPFVAFAVDVSAWFLTKLVGWDFVYLVIAGGATFISALGVMIVVSLWDMWVGTIFR